MKRFAALFLGVLSAWMLLVFAPPVSAGEWVIDRYEWSGKSHSELLYLDGGNGLYNMTMTPYDRIRHPTAFVGWAPKWERPFAGYGEPPTVNYLRSPPITLTGTLNHSVVAVFKWQRNQLWDMRLTNYDGEEYWEEYYYDDPDDNPTSLYILERSTLRHYRHLVRPHNASIGYSSDNPWSGPYIKVDVSSSMGASIGDDTPRYYQWKLDSSHAIATDPVSAFRFKKIRNNGDEAKTETVSFDGTVKLVPGYEKEVWDATGSGSFTVGYRPTQLKFSPSPQYLAINDCSTDIKGFNQYVITDGIVPTFIESTNEDGFFIEWLRQHASWELNGDAPALLPQGKLSFREMVCYLRR